MGVLITGDSAAGKSELALALLDRGHQLVCDDAPEIHKTDSGTLTGRCPPAIQDFLEVYGLGVLNIRKLFSNDAIKDEQSIQIVINLIDEKQILDNRLTGAENRTSISGVSLPTITLSKRYHRNLPLLVEIAVKNSKMKQKGYDPVSHLDNQQKRVQL